MLVYKFYNQKYGLEALKHRRLKLATKDDLNDPFEWGAVAPDGKEQRLKFRKFRRDYLEKYGLVSFSRSRKHPLMWSHYADGHRGMCLELEVPNSYLWRINYQPSRLPANIDSLERRSPEKQKELIKIIATTKFKKWEYENEERLMAPLDRSLEVRAERCGKEFSLYFEEFSRNLVLKRVFLGPEYSTSNDAGATAVVDKEDVEIVTTRLSFKRFSVEKQKCTKYWKQI